MTTYYVEDNQARSDRLANVCRQGDGDSAARMFKRQPEL